MPALISVLVMAAGRGERFSGRKQFFNFGESTVAGRACSLFKNLEEVTNIYLVYPPDMSFRKVKKEGKIPPGVEFVKGGLIREESVEKGLEKVKSEYVLIHDAARPFCRPEVIKRVIAEMKISGAAAAALTPDSSVVYREEKGSFVTLDRDRVYLIQTPQGYRSEDIRRAYACRGRGGYTDSSSVARQAGIMVKMVEGDKGNIKITRRGDYDAAVGGEK